MFKKSILKAAMLSLALVSFSACTKSSDSGAAQVANLETAPQAEDTPTIEADADAAYTAGTATATADVVAMTVFAAEGDNATAEEIAGIFASYPSLSHHVAELDAVDRVVRTSDSHLELYAGDAMVLALRFEGSSAVVAWSRADFRAESISYFIESLDAQNQHMTASQLKFHLRDCATEEKEQGQEQIVDKEQEQAQGKTEEKAQEQEVVKEEEQAQGKTEEKAQEQEQAKVEEKQEQAQDKEEVKEPVCADLVVTMDLAERIVEQKQAQEEPAKEEVKQEQGQAQEQTKETPVKEEVKQEQGQAQEPTKEVVKEEPAKEEVKEEAKDQSQEQGQG